MSARTLIEAAPDVAPDVARLIKKNGGRILPYASLPREAQAAVAFYMAVDGEAWECPSVLRGKQRKAHGQQIASALDYFVQHHGKEKFGYVVLPTQELLALLPDHLFTWNRTPGRALKTVWPVILDDEEVLQDGWHRFTDYVEAGLARIPCVYYPR